ILLKPHKEDEKKKSTFVSRFHTAFNVYYDNILKRYKKGTLRFIHKPWLTIGSVIAGIALLMFLMNITPTGLVPNEDTGTIMAVVDMPPGSSMERTTEVMQRIDSLLGADQAIESRTMIVGYSFLAGQGPSYGSFICKLKPWEERSIKQRSDFVSGMLYLKAREVIKDARVLLFAPPMIPGYSVSNGFELNLQDKTGGSLDKFYEVAQDFITKLQARPEIQSAQTSFNPNFPQYMIDIDAAACKKAGLSPNDILTTLQGYYGGLYSSNFNRFGKLYRVMIQADPDSRANLESLKSIKVRNGNEMAPITQFMSVKRIYGPDNIKRFNMFTAMTINGSPADGYSSGQAIQAMQEVAQESLPTGYGYEFSGMTREEQSSSGSSTAMIFVLCFVFVYLLLSAQYESYILPLAVLLSIPFGLAGSFIFAHLMGLANNIIPILGAATNNIYMQIALIMLMGLLAKNAILIVEFALDRRKMGMSITWAAVLGAGARLRPILMTSLAMVVGLIPLMLAMGVGANGNRALGTAAVGGMFIGMICQIFVVPALFVIFQYLQEKVKPMEWEDIDNSDAETEIEQYAK
ncbi:efflux RND transporter permease subunit, partial [Bacteroides sp. CAG:189]